jgi:nicotinamidase-related amidase
MMNPSSRAALLLIDVQQGLDDPRWGARNNPDAEQRMVELLAAWRATARPVRMAANLGFNAFFSRSW